MRHFREKPCHVLKAPHWVLKPSVTIQRPGGIASARNRVHTALVQKQLYPAKCNSIAFGGRCQKPRRNPIVPSVPDTHLIGALRYSLSFLLNLNNRAESTKESSLCTAGEQGHASQDYFDWRRKLENPWGTSPHGPNSLLFYTHRLDSPISGPTSETFNRPPGLCRTEGETFRPTLPGVFTT
jgi:hypothetical protein